MDLHHCRAIGLPEVHQNMDKEAPRHQAVERGHIRQLRQQEGRRQKQQRQRHHQPWSEEEWEEWLRQHRPIGAGKEWDAHLASLRQAQLLHQQVLQAECSITKPPTTTSTRENQQH